MQLKLKLSLIISIFHMSCYGTSQDFWARVDATSHSLHGTPYQLSSSKDLTGPEQGPILELSSLDCMTYVSYSLAAASPNPKTWLSSWLTIRYSKKPYDFSHRRHFASIDFNPVLENNFGLINAATLMPPSLSLKTTVRVAKDNWLLYKNIAHCQKSTCQLGLRDLQKAQKTSSAAIQYFPLSNIVKNGQLNPLFVRNIPDFTLVEFVRDNWPISSESTTNIAISHMGFLIKKNDTLWLRHAKWNHGVTDEPFLPYLQNIMGNPTMLGLIIFS
jgi:hypothetical protein